MLNPPATDRVQCELRERVATVVLNRPDALNALDRQMRDDLARLFGWCATHTDEVRAVLLVGNGRAFCSGQDLREGGDGASPAESIEAKRSGDFQTILADLPQPTVAALHGYTLGRGLEVALTCDVRMAADDARLGLPEARLGMLPASGGSQRLPRLIGVGRALHLLLSGEQVDAPTALAWGLVTRVVPAADLRNKAQVFAEGLAAQAPLALRYARRAVLEGAHLPLADGLRLEAALAAVLRTNEDRAEGIRAFRDKRPPRFSGR